MIPFIFCIKYKLEPTTGGSKFRAESEKIWKKQSGGLFRSNCHTLGPTPATTKRYQK